MTPLAKTLMKANNLSEELRDELAALRAAYDRPTEPPLELLRRVAALPRDAVFAGQMSRVMIPRDVFAMIDAALAQADSKPADVVPLFPIGEEE